MTQSFKERTNVRQVCAMRVSLRVRVCFGAIGGLPHGGSHGLRKFSGSLLAKIKKAAGSVLQKPGVSLVFEALY